MMFSDFPFVQEIISTGMMTESRFGHFYVQTKNGSYLTLSAYTTIVGSFSKETVKTYKVRFYRSNTISFSDFGESLKLEEFIIKYKQEFPELVRLALFHMDEIV